LRLLDFDIPEWMLLEQVDDGERLSVFISSEMWKAFSTGNDYLEFVSKYPMRNIVFPIFVFFQSKATLI
jgi:hypothetical protein